MFEFIIPGTPIAQKRPRLSKFGVFNPNSREKATVSFIIKSQMRNLGICSPLAGTLGCHLCVQSNRPALRDSRALYDVSRPDLDNYIKFYFDCMNKIVYNDDAQITFLLAKKILDDTPRVVIKIFELDDKRILD
jgi:Holliday junction resolvase RusA-like endonuclease